jgi:hypothetical protein
VQAREALGELVQRAPGDARRRNIILGAHHHLDRALDFIAITAAEFEREVGPWLEHTRGELERAKALPPGPNPVTNDDLRRMEIGRRLSVSLHLRIETFYVFAQVALDALVALVDLLRGPSQISLGRHRHVLRNLNRAVDAGELPEIPDELKALINAVTERIKDYRDDYVAHVRELRQLKATGFQLDTDAAYVQIGIVAPREGEKVNVQSESPSELLALLDAYLAAWVRYLNVALTAK